MKTMIVSGGWLRPAFLDTYLKKEKPDLVIAADRGMDPLYAIGRFPDLVLGDFDSTKGAAKEAIAAAGVPFETYIAEKDFTDTEAALAKAVELGADEIVLMGATGGRLDHFMGNLYGLLIPMRAGVLCRMIDEQNEVRLYDKSFEIRKEDAPRKYFSLIPLSEVCVNLTIRGCKYEVEGVPLERGSGRGISNEITEDTASVSFSEGILIVICSDDRGE